MRKYLAELIGTAALVIVGCGTAMLVGCDAAAGSGYLLTALAFGLTVMALAYSIGNISGCHVNPAVSLAFFIKGDLSRREFGFYVVAQIFGGWIGVGILGAIWGLGGLTDMTGAYGANSLSGLGGNAIAGFLVETVLTFLFVLVILGVTDSRQSHGNVAGLIIGLTLALVHILGIGLTGTSVNPARSLGPAIVAAITGNATPLSCVWVFIAGPLVGAALAAVIYRALED